jgi:hypothetical protein
MRRTGTIFATLATAAFVFVQPLSASAPEQAVGTEVTTSAATIDSRTADGNLIEQRVATRVLGGTFSGPMASTFQRITFKDGSRLSQGFETCDPCVVDGRTGTVVFRFQARTTERTVVTQAQLTIIGATGELEGLHGILRVTGNTYTGTYQFEPN